MKSVSGRELARLVERHGWQLLRVNGSHHIYEWQVFTLSGPFPTEWMPESTPKVFQASVLFGRYQLLTKQLSRPWSRPILTREQPTFAYATTKLCLKPAKLP